MAEHEIKAAAFKRERLGLSAGSFDLQPQALGVGAKARDHPGRDVGAGGLSDQPTLQQVEAEVAGSGADLERSLIALFELGADDLAELALHLPLPGLAEINAPFPVVACRRRIVIASVDIADLLRGPACLHGGGTLPFPASW